MWQGVEGGIRPEEERPDGMRTPGQSASLPPGQWDKLRECERTKEGIRAGRGRGEILTPDHPAAG